MLPPAFQALTASDLADQVELIKITQEAMSSDDMSKLWSAIQTNYRPSSAYQVSVVLIEGTKPAASPLPVLSRGKRDPVTHRDRGVQVERRTCCPPLPTLFTAETDFRRPAPGLATGHARAACGWPAPGTRCGLMHRLFSRPSCWRRPPVDATGASSDLPAAQRCGRRRAPWRRASWRRACASRRPARADARETNAIPLVSAPAPVIAADAALGLPAATVARGGVPPLVTVTLRSRPQVRPEQRARSCARYSMKRPPARPRTLPTDPLVFEFPDSLAAGSHWVRLRVDGADSVLLDRTGPAPVFDVTQQITVPP